MPSRSRRSAPRASHAERPWLLILFAAMGLAGCAALIAGTVIAPIYVPDHDWVADTISDLAAGRWEIIMDVALYGFAAGLFAVALAASHAHLGGPGWTAGIMALAALASIVTIIGARNEYGDGDNEGVVVHMYLVYAMGALVPVTCAVMQAGLRTSGHPKARWALIASGVCWAVLAPIFLMSPTGIDGLLERVLGLTFCAAVVVLSWVFLTRGMACLKEG